MFMACCNAGHQKLWFWQQPQRRYDLWCWKKWACFARQPNNFNIAQCILSPNNDKKVLSQPITLSLLRLRTSFWKIIFWLCRSRQTTLHFRVLGICLCRFCSFALSQALLAVQHINDKKANPGPLTPMAHGTILAYFLNSSKRWCNDR